MKMVMTICPETRREEIQNLIEKHEVHAYTEVLEVIGEGQTGKHLGTRLWPGKSIIIFTVVSAGKKNDLVAELKAFHDRLYPGEGLKVFVLPVEEAV